VVQPDGADGDLARRCDGDDLVCDCEMKMCAKRVVLSRRKTLRQYPAGEPSPFSISMKQALSSP
jgi:hypothetical protein